MLRVGRNPCWLGLNTSGPTRVPLSCGGGKTRTIRRRRVQGLSLAIKQDRLPNKVLFRVEFNSADLLVQPCHSLRHTQYAILRVLKNPIFIRFCLKNRAYKMSEFLIF